jgi:hypothetical protein
LNTPNERIEQGLLKSPEQVYEMNSSEMSKFEHELGFQQEKPKKKRKYKLKSAKSNPSMRSAYEKIKDAQTVQKGTEATREYREAVEAIRKDGTEPNNQVYNRTGPFGDSGMTPPEYLRNKLDKIGYNSWNDLVRDLLEMNDFENENLEFTIDTTKTFLRLYPRSVNVKIELDNYINREK